MYSCRNLDDFMEAMFWLTDVHWAELKFLRVSSDHGGGNQKLSISWLLRDDPMFTGKTPDTPNHKRRREHKRSGVRGCFILSLLDATETAETVQFMWNSHNWEGARRRLCACTCLSLHCFFSAPADAPGSLGFYEF